MITKEMLQMEIAALRQEEAKALAAANAAYGAISLCERMIQAIERDVTMTESEFIDAIERGAE